jgi:EpsI family protein
VIARATILAACFLVASLAIRRAGGSDEVPIAASLATFPLAIDAWRLQESEPIDDKVLAVLGVDDYINREYVRGSSDEALLYVGYYASQRKGDTIHSPAHCLPGSGWAPMSVGRRRLDVVDAAHPGGTSIDVNRYLLQRNGERELVMYWFMSHGRTVASEYRVKIDLVMDAIRWHRTDGALVRIIAPVQSNDGAGEAAAEASLVSFAQAAYPVLSRHLPAPIVSMKE